VPAEAFERAREALSHRERTTGELTEWLEARGYSRAEVESALTRLIETGAVDDERFAQRFAEDKRELSGWGPDRIREALAQRGLDRELVEAAVAGDGTATQLERAIELLERRGDPPVDDRSRARALAFLARRGYDVDLAYEAVRGVERRAA
jgi:regulatory protein